MLPPVEVGKGKPCPRCLAWFEKGRGKPDGERPSDVRRETVMPLHDVPAMNALAMDGTGPCCRDCESADNLMKRVSAITTFDQARTVIGNDRQEQLRLPGAPLGTVQLGITRPSQEGDLGKHLRWLDEALPE